MSKQTLMEDLFKLITNERRHEKSPFLLLSPVVIYPKFSSTAFSSASHSELNQEFTFVPHDLLKQFACHSSNMGSQSFSLPPCVTYLISSRLLHYSARTILVDARRPSFLGPKFSRFLCNFHDYPRAVLREFFPSICIESSSKMRALIQITHRTTFRLAFSCFVMQRLNLIKCNARWLKEINSISLIFTFRTSDSLTFWKRLEITQPPRQSMQNRCRASNGNCRFTDDSNDM